MGLLGISFYWLSYYLYFILLNACRKNKHVQLFSYDCMSELTHSVTSKTYVGSNFVQTFSLWDVGEKLYGHFFFYFHRHFWFIQIFTAHIS